MFSTDVVSNLKSSPVDNASELLIPTPNETKNAKPSELMSSAGLNLTQSPQPPSTKNLNQPDNEAIVADGTKLKLISTSEVVTLATVPIEEASLKVVVAPPVPRPVNDNEHLNVSASNNTTSPTTNKSNTLENFQISTQKSTIADNGVPVVQKTFVNSPNLDVSTEKTTSPETNTIQTASTGNDKEKLDVSTQKAVADKDADTFNKRAVLSEQIPSKELQQLVTDPTTDDQV